jgi:hypothetical protein
MRFSSLAIYASCLLTLSTGCGAGVTEPPTQKAESAPPVPSTGDSSETDAASSAAPVGSAAPACASTLESFCATQECPATWADAQAAAARWCTKPPAGVDAPTVSISTSACAGSLSVSVGDFGGPSYIYDASSLKLVAVYYYSDTSPAPTCAAGQPAAIVTTECPLNSYTRLCDDGAAVDGG